MNAGANFDPICVLACGVNESAKLLEIKATTRDEIDIAVQLGLNFPAVSSVWTTAKASTTS